MTLVCYAADARDSTLARGAVRIVKRSTFVERFRTGPAAAARSVPRMQRVPVIDLQPLRDGDDARLDRHRWRAIGAAGTRHRLLCA